MKTIFTIIILISSQAFALPEYEKPILEMSSSLKDGHNAPAVSLFVNSTPTINDKRNIGIVLSFIEGQMISGIWTKINEKISLPYIRDDGFRISDFNLKEDNQFSFTIHQESFFIDLIKLKLNTLGKPEIVSLKDLGGDISQLDNINNVYSSHTGLMLKGNSPQKGIYSLNKDNQLVLLVEENKDGVSYIFSPSYNKRGSLAFKARYGAMGEWAESRPDRIILKKNNESIIIASDEDANSASRWSSFRNGVSLNIKDEVCFVGIDSNGRANIVVSLNGKQKVVATEGKEVSKITYFTPIINDHGVVAFRGVNKEGLNGVFVTDGKRIKTILLEKDVLATAIGKVKIFNGRHIPFGGNIGFNNLGDIVINTAISDEKGLEDLGRAVISIYTKK